MQSESGVLETTIRKVFQKSERAIDMITFENFNEIDLIVIEKVNKNYLYVTDGVHNIMAIFTQKQEEAVHYPFNRSKTPFYTCDQKVHKYLNFLCITQPPSASQNSPYHPHFFMKDEYNLYIQNRIHFRCQSPCELLRVAKWRISVININETGYYGPLLIIDKYKKLSSQKPPNLCLLECILYKKWVQTQMQKYRLQDIKKLKNPSQYQILNKSSIFFHMRQYPHPDYSTKVTYMASLDSEKRILKFDQHRKRNFIIFGFLTGPCAFANAVQTFVDHKKMEELHTLSMAILFKNMKLDDNETEEGQKNNQRQLQWSDDSDSEKQHSQNIQCSETPMSQQNNQDSDEDSLEDPLKKLYSKTIAQNKGFI